MIRNKYYYSHNKLSNFLYDFTFKLSEFLIRHRWLYFILNYTWGILASLIGLLTTLILICCRQKPKRFYSTWYFSMFKNWGGVELGQCFIRDTTSIEHINNHEYGHTFQNAIYGPFFIFLVMIPSAIRYWYQRIRTSKHLPNKDYDCIWFEGNASEIGDYVVEIDKGEQK